MPEPTDDEPTPAESEVIRAVRESERKAQERAEQAERRLAFVEAGVDVTTPVGTGFSKTYEGELTPEAIRAAASTWGLLGGKEEPDPADVRTEAERRLAEVSESPGSDAPPPPPPPGDPIGIQVNQRFQELLREGRSRDYAFAQALKPYIGSEGTEWTGEFPPEFYEE
jgi:hypothetical protein